MGQSFTPDEFLVALSEDRFTRPIAVTGMVKKADEHDFVMFAVGTMCQNWVKIPIKKMVERVEWLGKTPCRDHAHEFVRLYLKQPEGPEAGVLAALLQASEGFGGVSYAESSSTLGPGRPYAFVGGISSAFPPFSPAGTLTGPEEPNVGGVLVHSGSFRLPGTMAIPESPNDSELYPNLLRFPGSTFDPCTPSYGRWCGNCRTASPDTPPLDDVDAACKAHDLCIDANGHRCDCDATFIASLTAILGSSRINGTARAYASAAITAFQMKPCFCYKRVAGQRIKVWGIGGRCPF